MKERFIAHEFRGRSDALRDRLETEAKQADHERRLETEAKQADHEREWREEHGEDPEDEGPGPGP